MTEDYWPEPMRDGEFWRYVQRTASAVPPIKQGYAKGLGHPRVRSAEENRLRAQTRQETR